MRIIGPASAERSDVFIQLLSWRRSERITSLFIDSMFDDLWDYSCVYHIDPVGVIAQSIKETGGGRFGGRVRPEWYNTCGLKIKHLGIEPGTGGDMPLAHQMFPNWEVGALAHVQHVCAYAGWFPNEIELPIVDPRWDYVWGKYKLSNWSELGGKWAPAITYGTEIETLMTELIAKGGATTN